MAVSVVLSEIERDALVAVCDTFAPSVDEPNDANGRGTAEAVGAAA